MKFLFKAHFVFTWEQCFKKVHSQLCCISQGLGEPISYMWFLWVPCYSLAILIDPQYSLLGDIHRLFHIIQSVSRTKLMGVSILWIAHMYQIFYQKLLLIVYYYFRNLAPLVLLNTDLFESKHSPYKDIRKSKRNSKNVLYTLITNDEQRSVYHSTGQFINVL